MYSVVLMAALATGGSTPATWFNCHGFGGGGCCGGCYGGGHGCSGGCYGTSYGCCGGGCCGGCYGSNWGSWGSSCHGCYGCCGGCCGGYSTGCCGGCCGGYSYGCCGGCTGSSCYGCYGGAVYTSPVITTPGAYTAPTTYLTPGYQNVVPTTTTNYPGTSTYATPVSSGYDHQTSTSPAKLLITLPTDAKLYVDGQLTSSTSENRVFTTPDLQNGLTYFYDLKAEITRDGLTHTENKRVIVRSGDSIRASFAVLEAKLKNAAMTTTAAK